jgi:hypothetical protein
LESADVVLLGTVISAEFPAPPEHEEPATETKPEERTATSMADLLRQIHESNTYLVFGYKGEDGIHTISTVCGSTQIADNAKERIEILDELAERNTPPNSIERGVHL